MPFNFRKKPNVNVDLKIKKNYNFFFRRTDFKAELKKINKSIISKVLELFEYSSKGSENLQDILSDIMKLVEKFYEITTYIKHTVQVKIKNKNIFFRCIFLGTRRHG